jgi:hypothetical protein
MARFIPSIFYSGLTGYEKKSLTLYDVNQLKAIAKKYGLKGYSRLTKNQLVLTIQSSKEFQRARPKPKAPQQPSTVIQQIDLTIAERITKNASGSKKSRDWYANELMNELSQYGETRFPKIGELCFFYYSAKWADKYPWWDRRPLVYIMDIQEDRLFGANLHYLNPDYRDAVAGSLINKKGAYLPEKTIHSYLFSGLGDIFIVPFNSKEWAEISLLPTEYFVDKYGNKVESQRVWDSP